MAASKARRENRQNAHRIEPTVFEGELLRPIRPEPPESEIDLFARGLLDDLANNSAEDAAQGGLCEVAGLIKRFPQKTAVIEWGVFRMRESGFLKSGIGRPELAPVPSQMTATRETRISWEEDPACSPKAFPVKAATIRVTPSGWAWYRSEGGIAGVKKPAQGNGKQDREQQTKTKKRRTDPVMQARDKLIRKLSKQGKSLKEIDRILRDENAARKTKSLGEWEEISGSRICQIRNSSDP